MQKSYDSALSHVYEIGRDLNCEIIMIVMMMYYYDFYKIYMYIYLD